MADNGTIRVHALRALLGRIPTDYLVGPDPSGNLAVTTRTGTYAGCVDLKRERVVWHDANEGRDEPSAGPS